jgi:NADH-quinone oxidoreductase subunit G
MTRIFIDGRPVWARDGATVLDAAKAGGLRIPHLCKHSALPPEGSCRICLVEVEGLPKLELACSTVVREDMRINTACPPVREARRAVLELLLTEHPLDCPICDKAGECKLQDYAYEYGLTGGSFAETRRKRDKLVRIGANLILDRERCILCTRCVRFLAGVAGAHELGIFERGAKAEIGLYEDRPIESIDAGNLVDLCPVGAITDARFRFRTRPWFLEAKPTICPFCARGCAMEADLHPGFARRPGTSRIFRFRPRLNPDVNGYWICDRGRYGSLDLDLDRLSGAVLRGNGRADALTWEQAGALLADRIRGLGGSGGGDRLAVLLSSRLMNEDLALAARLFREKLRVRRFAFLDPPDGQEQGLLLRPDRSANRRGADRLGFDRTAGLEAALRGADMAVVLAADPAGTEALREREEILAAVPFKALIAPQTTGLEPLMDLVLGAATVFEKAGSFLSEGEREQSFKAVHASCLDVRSELWILSDLGLQLGLDGFAAAEGVR